MSLAERLEHRNGGGMCAVAAAASRLEKAERDALYGLVDLRNDRGEYRFTPRTVSEDVKAEGVHGVGEAAVRDHRAGVCGCAKS